MPALSYEQAFDEVCKVIDEHPELGNRRSREAVTFAVDSLWKRKDQHPVLISLSLVLVQSQPRGASKHADSKHHSQA